MHASLEFDAWQALERAHHERIDTWMGPHLSRRSQHIKDPVADFLFEYYPFPPSHVRRWSPGPGVALLGAEADRFLRWHGFSSTVEGVILDPGQFPRKLVQSTQWIHDFLVATRERAPQPGCSGLHEWAMLYSSEPVRHGSTPLRLSRSEIDRVVETSTLTCTHFDAFRFFNERALPMNAHALTRASMPRYEQSACLHANMDLYRWAMKRSPWIPSDLAADAFFLAVEIREVDMRASPYDLSEHGLNPIRVETREGRREFAKLQSGFQNRAAIIRQRLIDAYASLLASLPTEFAPAAP